jgi:prepilin-type processing-associated H-X9-DG protein
MHEHFVGYLLDALDPDERQLVESHLRANPEARRQLNHLREFLQPLAADRNTVEPPPGLWVRTLACVAEHQCRRLPSAPPPPPSRPVVPNRGWWRRADLLVAASIFLCLALLIPPGINKLRYLQNITTCKENLHQFYHALKVYSDHQGGAFPNVATAAPAPKNVAGLVVPILRQSVGFPPDGTFVTCPAQPDPPSCSVSLREVEEMDPEEFARRAPGLAGVYAYTLGYDDGTGLQGMRLETGAPNQVLPLMADQPPLDIERGGIGNSPNHGGRGQNVLYIDGHCAFQTTRHVGFEGDDIYLNQNDLVRAGTNLFDAVLGRSAARP